MCARRRLWWLLPESGVLSAGVGQALPCSNAATAIVCTRWEGWRVCTKGAPPLAALQLAMPWTTQAAKGLLPISPAHLCNLRSIICMHYG